MRDAWRGRLHLNYGTGRRNQQWRFQIATIMWARPGIDVGRAEPVLSARVFARCPFIDMLGELLVCCCDC